MYNPKNIGLIRNADAVGECQNQENLETVKFSAVIENEIIKQIKFKVFGNAVLIALASMTTEIVRNKNLENVVNLKEEDILTDLYEIPMNKRYCIDIILHALLDLVEDYRKKQERLAKKFNQEKNDKI